MLAAALGLPLLAFPKIKVPAWVWTVLAVVLLLLGYAAHVERLARERARNEMALRENERIRRALDERLSMEKAYEDDWSARPADRDELADRLRRVSF